VIVAASDEAFDLGIREGMTLTQARALHAGNVFRMENGKVRLADLAVRFHAAADTCLSPVILVHPNGSDAAYIAASGFETS